MNDIDLWKQLISTVIPLKQTKVKTEVHKQYFKKVIYEISYVLDLHGYTVQEAYDKLIDFLTRHYTKHTKYITVITGKGNINKEGLIHREVEDWLTSKRFYNYIRSYEWINGNGALKIYLKREK